MKTYILLLLSTLTLCAQNPKSFAVLGDVIYDDVSTFQTLKSFPPMSQYKEELNTYIISANKTKKIGYKVDVKESSITKKNYLEMLRKLSKKHDAIDMSVKKCFANAITDEDSATINTMVGLGVIDPTDYKGDLINYYEEFGEDHNLSNIKSMYELYVIPKHKDTNNTKNVNKNEERIKRMRAKAKAKDEALVKAVSEEKKREKAKVLSAQKEELGIQ